MGGRGRRIKSLTTTWDIKFSKTGGVRPLSGWEHWLLMQKFQQPEWLNTICNSIWYYASIQTNRLLIYINE